LDGAWFSFATGGDAANVVDRFEAREAGGRVTFYRGGAPMESYAVEGTQLVGAVRASVAPGGDILWSHGYTSRREGAPAAQRIARRPATRETIFDPAHYANGGPRGDQDVGGVVCACAPCMVLCPLQALARAGQESEIPNFKGSYLGRFPLVSADSWTSDHLSERSRSVDAFSGTRARKTLTLKRR